MTNTLQVIDMHTAGEPVRIISGGYPILEGATILEKRQRAMLRYDHIRKMMMLEPRGHSEMYGVIPTEPSRMEADAAVLFMHGAGYSTMCGHATIAMGRHLIESGAIKPVEGQASFILECPCGLVRVTSSVEGGRVSSTSFESVPSFEYTENLSVETAQHGIITTDIAYGGAFYAIAPASRFGLDLFESSLDDLKRAAVDLTDSIRTRHEVVHPTEPDLGFLYGTILTEDAAVNPAGVNHHLCFFADGQLDRSPTGSGVTARLAMAFSRREVAAGVSVAFKGISGIAFRGKVVREEIFADKNASIVEVSGSSHYTGRQEFIIEEDDPIKDGLSMPERPADLWRHHS